MSEKDLTRINESDHTIPIKEAIKIIGQCVKLQQMNKHVGIPSLIGKPGIGKTEMLMDYAIENNLNLVACVPALEPPEKFGGIPDLIKEQDGTLSTIWSVPELVCTLRSLSTNGKWTVVLFDDWHLCSKEIQQIGFELFTHHQIHGHKLPKNCSIILAGNDSMAAGMKPKISAIQSRCFDIKCEPDVNQWVTEYAIPEQLNPELISFFELDNFKEFFSEEESTQHPFGCPRQWSNAFRFLDYYISEKEKSGKSITSKELLTILNGYVSRRAASEFTTYFIYYKNINIRKIFDTGVCEFPDANDTTKFFAFAHSAGMEYVRRLNKFDNPNINMHRKVFKEIFEYVMHHRIEYALMLFHKIILMQNYNEEEGMKFLYDLNLSSSVMDEFASSLQEIDSYL